LGDQDFRTDSELKNYTVMNILAAFFGWLAFNVAMFRIEKDTYDDKHQSFPLKQYASETWDNWLASLACIPVLLFIGYYKLQIPSIGVLEGGELKWSDFYYLCSGFATELVIVAIKKWRKKQAQ
jgi:hypothetical protein